MIVGRTVLFPFYIYVTVVEVVFVRSPVAALAYYSTPTWVTIAVVSSQALKDKKKKKEASFPIDSSLLFFSVWAALLNPSSTLAPWFFLGCCYAGMAKQTIRKLDL